MVQRHEIALEAQTLLAVSLKWLESAEASVLMVSQFT